MFRNIDFSRREYGCGWPKMLDNVDERFDLECIENKSTADGKRFDAVMYAGRRVKAYFLKDR